MNRTRWIAIAAAAFLVTGLAIVHAGNSPAKSVTFNRDVAPILFKNCAECHRPGEAAPMSLLSFKDARPWARSIREKVVSRQMPPWHADPHVGEFANDRRLSKSEI
ncbi:MAG TPA: cytochrome c, partial [Blastocatellia bacterium]|nr:cytochrome c [Blastocatellia bacterium]